jgi:formylglycine-generating enzyme required for sulfatase activity
MGSNPSATKGDPTLPVHMVTFNESKQLINRLNASRLAKYRLRLPTDAEWEYAARAGTKGITFFGDDVRELSKYAWTKENSGGKLHPVAQLAPNPAGLFDVYGNVYEWTQDGTVRGGSSLLDASDATSIRRETRSVRPDERWITVGLRLACQP